MSKRGTTKRNRSLARPFVVTVAAIGLPGAIAVVGCGTSQPDAGNGNGIGPGGKITGNADDGTCSNEGDQRACHLTVGQSGPFLTCYQGTQTCAGGLWSPCGGTGTITNALTNAPLKTANAGGGGGSGEAGGLHPLAPIVCGDGICSGGGFHCKGGTNAGALCGVNSDCNSGNCAQGTCNGGFTLGQPCNTSFDCLGSKCIIAKESCATCAADCGLCPPGSASSGATVCTTDPCTPGCEGFTNSNPLTLGTGVTSVIGVTGFGQIAGGQLKKVLLDSCNGAGSDCDQFGTYGLPSSTYACQMDTYCSMTQNGGDGCCHQFAPSTIDGADVTSVGPDPGIDITIGPGCSDVESDKYRYFPVCNRGTVATAGSVPIYLKVTTPVQPLSPCPGAGACTPATADCSVMTPAAGLAPGQCVLLDTEAPGCTGQPSGVKWMYINCDGSIPEGTINSTAASQAAPDSEPATSLGCSNNWTIHSQDNNPPSCHTTGAGVTQYQINYKATCPPGYGPQWSLFSYDTTCPANASGTSEVAFSAAMAPDVGGVPGAFSAPVTIAEAQHNNGGNPPGSDPEVCNATTPATPPYIWNTCSNADTSGTRLVGPTPPCCPKDILAQFNRPVAPPPNIFAGFGTPAGLANAQLPWLQLNITLKTTPDGAKAPVVNGFNIAFTCIGQE